MKKKNIKKKILRITFKNKESIRIKNINLKKKKENEKIGK